MFALLLFLVVPATATADECADAPDYLAQNRITEAENAARACLQDSPDNAAAMVVLARALLAQDEFTEALSWAEKAQAKYPQDLDIATLRMQILARSGDLDAAWAVAVQLPAAAKTQHDPALVAANIAFWREDYAEAAARYDSFVAQWPGEVDAERNRAIAYDKTGRSVTAQTEYERLCRAPYEDDLACALYTQKKKENAKYTLALRPGYWLATRSYNNTNKEDNFDGYSGYAMIDARVFGTFHLGTSLEYRTRDYGDGDVSDTYWELFGNYTWPVGFKLSAAAGMTLDDTDFSPEWTAQIEPGWVFDFGLELYFKFWRLEFEKSGVNVLSPAAAFYYGPLMLYARYYYAIDEDPDTDPSNSFLAKAGWTFFNHVTLTGGYGAGDRTDYLEVTDANVDNYWLALGGIGIHFNWQHSVFLDYIYRDETSSNDRIDVDFIQHQFLLTYQVRF